MARWIELLPAYGRDYKNQDEVRADWEAGKDFRHPTSGRYVNKEDAERYGLKVMVRYAGFKKVMEVTK